MVCGQGLLLAELSVVHLGAGVFKKLGVVEGLELGSEAVGVGEGCGGVFGRVYKAGGGVDEAAGLCEVLKIDSHVFFLL